jgi:hypothetical protein
MTGEDRHIAAMNMRPGFDAACISIARRRSSVVCNLFPG